MKNIVLIILLIFVFIFCLIFFGEAGTMKEKISSNILFPILGVVISGLISRLTSKNTIESDKLNESNKILKDFSKILIEKRIEIYPELWALVSNIYGTKKIKVLNKSNRGEEAVVYNCDKIRPELRIWRKKNGIFLSKRKKVLKYKDGKGGIFDIETSSLLSFQNLENALYLKEKYTKYDDIKIQCIDKWRNVLLMSIQEDIGILDKSEKSLNNKI